MARPTGRGAAVLAVAAAALVAGQVLGHPALRALGGAALGAVAAALVVVVGRPKVAVEREVYPGRVRRGGAAFARLRVRDAGGRGQRGFTAADRVGVDLRAVAVRPLPPGGEVVHHYELPTDRRGRHDVGPLTLERVDPLGLARHRVTAGGTTTLWVHPKDHPVRAVAAGFPRHHHEGRTDESAPRGSLDLRDVREYVVGDEIRHLHWKATARTGRLMVRDYADPEQPRFTALLDTRPGPGDPDAFEEAVDLTASLVTAAAAAGHRCRLLTPGGMDVRAEAGAEALRRVLDELSLVASDADGPLVPSDLERSGGGFLAVVLARPAVGDAVALARLRRRFPAMAVVVLGGDPLQVPGARVLRAADAAEAAHRWNAVIAR